MATTRESGSPLARIVGFAILFLVVGIPAFLVVTAATLGAIFAPIVGLLLLAPLLLVHYLLYAPLPDWPRQGSPVPTTASEEATER